MQHHAEVEPKRIVLDRLARAEEMILSGQEEEDWCSEKHTTFLQCADSLAIAVNRIQQRSNS